jgi:hypothetical protein
MPRVFTLWYTKLHREASTPKRHLELCVGKFPRNVLLGEAGADGRWWQYPLAWEDRNESPYFYCLSLLLFMHIPSKLRRQELKVLQKATMPCHTEILLEKQEESGSRSNANRGRQKT